MRAGLALIVLILDVVVITSILGARNTAGRKLVWCAAVVLLPLVGAVGWLTVGRASPRAARQTTEMTGSQ